MERRGLFLISQIYLMACLCCGIIHMIFITQQYFQYRTTSRISMDKRQRIDTPSLIACVRFAEVLNYTALSRNMGISLKPNPTMDELENLFGDKITIRDIFQHTPSEDGVLQRCTYRRRQDRRVLLKEDGDCGYFRMTKFVMQSYVCYSMQPRHYASFSIDDLTTSYNFEHTIYSVAWADWFMKVQTLLVILSDNDLPYRSRTYASIKLLESSHLTNTTHVTDILVRRKITKVILQEKPYDTGCTQAYSLGDKTSCLIDKMRKHKVYRVPSTEIITIPYDLKQVMIRDEENKTTRHLLDQIYDLCDTQTDGEKCNYTISETDARFYESDHNSLLTFRVMSPMSANVLIASHPSIRLHEYMLFISSCMGMWFGVSVMHLNPMRMLPRIRRRVHRWCNIMSEKPVNNYGQQRKSPSEWTHVFPITKLTINDPRRAMPSAKLAATLNQQI